MDDSNQEKKEQDGFLSFLSLIGIDVLSSRILFGASLALVLASAAASFLMLPPEYFPTKKVITIEKGVSLSGVSDILKRENIIRSRTLFELCARVIGGEKPVLAGDYLFKQPLSACSIAARIAHGELGIPMIRITIPEGMSNVEIAAVLGKNIPQFDRNAFFETWSSKEGFLFPDTYLFPETVTTQVVAEKMYATFSRKIEPLEEEITASGHSLRDVVIMASILEKEAATAEDRAIVSGILWKRIEKGMPLQVDATFLYLLGKKSSELTLGDLQMKSAYNTYINKGLPYGPIGNPGLDTIKAAIHPEVTPYLYYLSDDDGVMHYAKTFEEHKANKAKYLR